MAQACRASLKAFRVGNSWRRCRGGIAFCFVGRVVGLAIVNRGVVRGIEVMG